MKNVQLMLAALIAAGGIPWSRSFSISMSISSISSTRSYLDSLSTSSQVTPTATTTTTTTSPPPLSNNNVHAEENIATMAAVSDEHDVQDPSPTTITSADEPSLQIMDEKAFFLDLVEKTKEAVPSSSINGNTVVPNDDDQEQHDQQDSTTTTTTLEPPPQQLEQPPPPPPPRPVVVRPPRDLTKTRTQRIMEKTSTAGQTGGAGGSSTWDAFLQTEANWAKLKASKAFSYDIKWLQRVQNGIPPPTAFVTDDGAMGNPQCWAKLRAVADGKALDFDIVVCGGTLGIFFATALQLQGHKVCVVEAGRIRGREQEWNISMEELLQLIKLGLLTQDDVDAAVTTEFPGCRSGFKNQEVTPLKGGYFENGIGYECFTPNVLNLGVSPTILLERVSKRFIELGGTIQEQTRLQGVVVSEALGAAVDLGDVHQEPITTRLVLDCMGNASPISRQQRYGQKPDGVCAVVGSCAAGYDASDNLVGDIIYTNTEMQNKGPQGMQQYFWETFPVGIGRNGKEPGTSNVKTTYMFTYMDASDDRPSFATLMEDYWNLLPMYQPSIQDPEDDLDVKRVLFAYFPTYRDSPLQPQWSRVLAVGDASGIQSPLSFGGFGALTRHLGRIAGAVSEALDNDCLQKEDLAEINAYTPNLSATWMFQRAMSVRMGRTVDPKFVNRLLATNFEVMEEMGPRTIKPFLQDVVRFDGLVGSLARSFVADPMFMPQIVQHVGIPTLVDWLGHVSMMGLYTVLDGVASPIVESVLTTAIKDPRTAFQWRRRMEAWKFGSGRDYTLPKE